MSGLKEIQCELPEKPWKDYSSVEMRRYCLRNLKNADCSFIAEDKNDNKAAKVHKSFKWILSEISPVLKKILNDEENQAKNCKEIVVSNPNQINAILFYCHLKVIDTDVFNLVDFYEASKEYQVKALEDEVIKKMFNSIENQKNANWVKLFWLSYLKYPKDQQMRAIFERVKGHVDCTDKFAEATIDLIMDFDKELFDTFLNISLSQGSKCFKITEAYLIQHFCEGNKDKKLEEIDLFERNLVEWYMNEAALGSLWWDHYKNGPLVSNLLTTKRKIVHLEIILKENKYPSPKFFESPTLDNEIRSYIQKLREAESRN